MLKWYEQGLAEVSRSAAAVISWADDNLGTMICGLLAAYALFHNAYSNQPQMAAISAVLIGSLGFLIGARYRLATAEGLMLAHFNEEIRESFRTAPVGAGERLDLLGFMLIRQGEKREENFQANLTRDRKGRLTERLTDGLLEDKQFNELEVETRKELIEELAESNVESLLEDKRFRSHLVRSLLKELEERKRWDAWLAANPESDAAQSLASLKKLGSLGRAVGFSGRCTECRGMLEVKVPYDSYSEKSECENCGLLHIYGTPKLVQYGILMAKVEGRRVVGEVDRLLS